MATRGSRKGSSSPEAQEHGCIQSRWPSASKLRAGLRQADDLLSAVDADAGGHPRDPARSRRPTTAPAFPGPAARRPSGGASRSSTRCSREPAGIAQAFVIGARFHRRRSRSRWCSATTSSTDMSLSQTPAGRARASAARPSSATGPRSRALWRRRSSTRAAAWSTSRRSRPAAVQLRGHRALFLRQPMSSRIAATLEPSARGELEITDVNPPLPAARTTESRQGSVAAARGSTREHTTRCSTRSMFVRIVEERRGLEIACVGRSHFRVELYRQSPAAQARRSAGEERLWRVSRAHARRRVRQVKFLPTALRDVVLIEPRVHGDERGLPRDLAPQTVRTRRGIDYEFVAGTTS